MGILILILTICAVVFLFRSHLIKEDEKHHREQAQSFYASRLKNKRYLADELMKDVSNYQNVVEKTNDRNIKDAYLQLTINALSEAQDLSHWDIKVTTIATDDKYSDSMKYNLVHTWIAYLSNYAFYREYSNPFISDNKSAEKILQSWMDSRDNLYATFLAFDFDIYRDSDKNKNKLINFYEKKYDIKIEKV